VSAPATPAVDDGGRPNAASSRLARLARTANVLRALLPLRPTAVLAIGADLELPAWIRHFTGAEVLAADPSLDVCCRAREVYGVPSLAADATYLPFPDAFFDVVVASEVIENVDDPFAALREGGRLARRAFLLTCGAVERNASLRAARLRLRPPAGDEPARSSFLAAELVAMLGPPIALRSQHRFFLGGDAPAAGSRAELRLLERIVAVPERPISSGVGLLGLWAREPTPASLPARDPRVAELLRGLLHDDPATLLRRDLGPEPYYLLTELERERAVPTFFSTFRPQRPPLPEEERLRQLFDPANVARDAAERAVLAERLRREEQRLRWRAADTWLRKLRIGLSG
jgi:SAM-dependent methyltransferase